MGKISVVATPIGNLEDITLRALRVLKEADYVLCEDTRVTGKLLKKYDIPTQLKRYDAHASDRVHEQILADLEAGKHVALVSDAGTPGVSDPGVLLLEKITDHNKQNPTATIAVEAVPGASAVTTAFSVAGLTGNQFTFLGFVPQKKGRETFFKNLPSYSHPVIFFESTHRIMKTLQSLVDHSADSKVTIARELTKLHEEVVSGDPTEVLNYFLDNPDHQKGEFVVIVS